MRVSDKDTDSVNDTVSVLEWVMLLVADSESVAERLSDTVIVSDRV